VIVGWAQKTALGVRLWESQRGRYFHGPASARARETVLARRAARRSAATWRREPYHLNCQHLDGPHIAVRVWRGNPNRAA
jgi:hypothetical protein